MPKPLEIYNNNKLTLQTFAIEGGIQLHDSYSNEQTDSTATFSSAECFPLAHSKFSASPSQWEFWIQCFRYGPVQGSSALPSLVTEEERLRCKSRLHDYTDTNRR